MWHLDLGLKAVYLRLRPINTGPGLLTGNANMKPNHIEQLAV